MSAGACPVFCRFRAIKAAANRPDVLAVGKYLQGTFYCFLQVLQNLPVLAHAAGHHDRVQSFDPVKEGVMDILGDPMSTAEKREREKKWPAMVLFRMGKLSFLA